ncbi:hypothetical protein AX16_010641 [Volvariella volvacea WC 439]|nr:hypothetical protein AX16_010641 [Volvariella volvacea WC 439]
MLKADSYRSVVANEGSPGCSLLRLTTGSTRFIMNKNASLDDEMFFTVSFPLPYRVLALAGLGILGWATNLHGLSLLGIDAAGALELQTDQSKRHTLPSHRTGGFRQVTDTATYATLYRIFIIYSLCCFTSWASFRYGTQGDPTLLDAYGYIPAITVLVFFAILICPYNIFFKTERDKFLHSLRRCCFSSADSPVYFADVVFADIFTSFSKVLGDGWLSLRMVFPGNSLLSPPHDSGWQNWILPTAMSLPFLVRFKQCLIEYGLPMNESRRPLFNALKYATSFPVLYLSSFLVLSTQKDKETQAYGEDRWHGHDGLFRLWLLATAINSCYSLWWDITNDWGMELLRPDSADSRLSTPTPPRRLLLPRLHSHPQLASPNGSAIDLGEASSFDFRKPSRISVFGLRPTLLFPTYIYPTLIATNLILRLIWLVKLSSHLHIKTDGTIGTFMFELCEIIRRWLWVFIRVEWEVVRRAQERSRAITLDYSDYPSEDEQEMASPTLIAGAT